MNWEDSEDYVSAIDTDLAYIAAGLFAYESFLKEEGHSAANVLSILVRVPDGLRNDIVEETLTDLLAFTLKVDTKVKLVGVKSKSVLPSKKVGGKFGSVCLFSGGIDSLSGIGQTKDALGPTHGVFVHHDGLSGIVGKLEERYLKQSKTHVHRIGTQTGPEGLQQLRGFVYMTVGGISAHLHNTTNVVISEVGHTMFQPELTALDEVTLTTHPTLVRLTKTLLKQAYNRDFDFYEPFADLTKAETIALCEFKEGIPYTNSCRTTRWAYSSVSHCGCCYGCIVRRVSCIVAGVKDANYAADVLLRNVGDDIFGRRPGSKIKTEHLDNLYALLRFARDIVENKLDDIAEFKIRTFAKQELYRRFALDILSALYVLYDQDRKGSNVWVKKFYDECKKDGIITPDSARNRIQEVREQEFKPDFGFKL